MSKISRRDFLKVTGIAAAAAALTACGGSSSTASSTASSAAASSEVVKKLDKISVAVPNDTTNEARALALLEKNGFFKVKADAGLTATKNDIEENPFNVNIDEVEAAQGPSVLQDEDYAVINSNYAISAGLNPVEDALAIEDGSSAYVNVLVCKDGNQESPKIKALAAALESQQVKDFIDEKYAGSVVFVVENPTDGYDSTVDYDALNGETVSCAATPAPHCEILEICKDILAQKGITLDVQEFDDYIQPNNVVEDGQIDTNYFQHQPYLDDFNQEHGTHLVTVAGIHVEPMVVADLFYKSYRIRREQTEQEMEAEVQATMGKAQKLILSSVAAINQMIDEKDHYTSEHSRRVAQYSRIIAKHLDPTLSEEELERLYRSALLHDIGKIAVPDAILNKSSRLTDAEADVMRQHTLWGKKILAGLEFLPQADLGASYHHERYDGTGYPAGLMGEDLPRMVWVIAAADALDAMSSNRCYRKRCGLDYILSEFERGRGTQFSPEVADAVIDLLQTGGIPLA